jgi:RecA/RadA recombinase
MTTRKPKSSKLKETVGRLKKRAVVAEEKAVDFISTGCILLNLIGSFLGRSGGFARGRIINIIGKGSAGKTLIALEFLAYCHYFLKKVTSRIFPKVKKIYLRFNNAEGVMDFPLHSMYGTKKDPEGFFKAVEWYQEPHIEAWSREFIRRINKLKKGEALVEVVDSWDTFATKEEDEEFDSAIDKDKDLDGSYNLGQQRFATKFLMKKLCKIMVGKDVTLILLSQMKVKIGAGKYEKQTYRAGGTALDFYTHQCFWLYHVTHLKHKINGEEKIYGSKTRVVVERNKVAPAMEKGVITIIRNYGIDDIRTCIDYYYGPEKKILIFDGEKYERPKLIKHLEENPYYVESLRSLVIKKFKTTEEKNDVKMGAKKYANIDAD